MIWKAYNKFGILGLFKVGMENDGAKSLLLSLNPIPALPALGSFYTLKDRT